MIKNSLIIIPLHLSWKRTADYQYQTGMLLASKNIVIVYQNNYARFFLKRPIKPSFTKNNILFFTPRYIIPFRRIELIERVNQLLNIWYLCWRFGHGKKKIVWIFDPHFWFFPYIKWLMPDFVSIYDCVDYVWNSDVNLRTALQRMEKKLITLVDHFFVNSNTLKKIHARIRRATSVVPLGFDAERFADRRAKAPVTFPNNRPIAGFVGAIDMRFDFALFSSLVKTMPSWIFVLWGPINTYLKAEYDAIRSDIHRLSVSPNIIIGQSRDKREIPAVVKQFTVCIVPYDTQKLSVKYSYPMKIMEYLYVGKPVISTPIDEVKRLKGLVQIATTAAKWRVLLQAARTKSPSKLIRNKMKRFALQHTWQHKIDHISTFL